MDWGQDDHGGLDDIFVPRDPHTGDPVPQGLEIDRPIRPRRRRWLSFMRRRDDRES
ncbi:MAG TPA: hypothetical protein VJ804_02205 [Acidimicrobiales bacterium]|nr:hypothetical protein [Acidimicrobiales bacterium]